MKELEHDDPMELHGMECWRDPNYRIDCVTQEYLRLGWPPEQIAALFESPSFPVLQQMLRAQGGGVIRGRIEQIEGRWGVFRFETLETPEEPELVTD